MTIAIVLAFAAVLVQMRALLAAVARARTTLFSVFLLVPMDVVVQLAARTIRAEAAGSADGVSGGAGGLEEEEEEAWDPQVALSGGGALRGGRTDRRGDLGSPAGTHEAQRAR